MSAPVVKVGQIWGDCDWRSKGRLVQVMQVDGDRVVVRNTATGHQTLVALKRFRPTSTGYRLMEDVK